MSSHIANILTAFVSVVLMAAPNASTVLLSTQGACVGAPVVVYGVPEGTHTFTVAALWTQALDATLPRVVATTTGASTTITIKP